MFRNLWNFAQFDAHSNREFGFGKVFDVIARTTVDINPGILNDFMECLVLITGLDPYYIMLIFISTVLLSITSLIVTEILTHSTDKEEGVGKSQETKPQSQEDKPQSQDDDPKPQDSNPDSKGTKPEPQDSNPDSKGTKPKKGKSSLPKPISIPSPESDLPEVVSSSSSSKPKFISQPYGPQRPPRPFRTELPYMPPAHIIQDLNDKLRDGTISKEQFDNQLSKLLGL